MYALSNLQIVLVATLLAVVCFAATVVVASLRHSPATQTRLAANAFPIPQRIVQTHRYASLETMPAPLRRQVNKLRQAHLHWKYKFFNDAQQRAYIAAHMPVAVLRAYDAIDEIYGPAKADLFRYCIIYHDGGVYLDAKSGVRPADNLDRVVRDRDLLLAHWPGSFGPPPNRQAVGLVRGEYINWCIAARPKHPALRFVIDAVVEAVSAQKKVPHQQRLRGKQGVIDLTGPVRFTLAVEDFYRRNPQEKKPEVISNYQDVGLQYHNNEESRLWVHDEFVRDPRHYSRLRSPIVP